MNITGINFKFTMINISEDHTFDHTTEWDIPFTGEDLVITKFIREEIHTKVCKYPLDQEIISRIKALIDKYGITDWIGKTPALPKIIEPGNSGTPRFFTLRSDNGTEAEITFREADASTGNEASSEFSKLFFDLTTDDKKLSEELTYPTLKECRNLKEKHGPVVAVETSSFEMGMMYNSNIWYRQLIEKIPDKEGFVRVTLRRKQGDLPEQTDTKDVASDILDKVQEISEKENLPVWNYAAIDPSIPPEYVVMDYSASSNINVYYDDSLITGAPKIKRTIGESACKMGGKEVDKAISMLIRECVAASGAHIEISTVNPFLAPATQGGMPGAPGAMTQFMGMGTFMNQTPQTPAAGTSEPAPTGPWDCPCGQKGNTGKFCPECGGPRC
jgi:hypothetical protein